MPDVKPRRARTCIGCGAQSTKGDLRRIVRTPDGAVAFDATGRQPGRGAYVCSLKCLEQALKAKKLQRALKATVGHEDADRVVNEMVNFLASNEVR